MLELIADILQNSKLEPAAIERERGVILTEKEKVEENIEEVRYSFYYKRNHQIAKSIPIL